jgi:hypothetical protein
MQTTIRWLIFGVIAVILSSCLGGSENLHDEDASGEDRIEFEFLAESTGGHVAKDLLISGMEETEISYSVVITNHGPRPQEVSWCEAPGSDESGMISVKPGASQAVVISATGTASGTVLAGLTSEPNKLEVSVIFESPLPEGTRLRARLVWADGP